MTYVSEALEKQLVALEANDWWIEQNRFAVGLHPREFTNWQDDAVILRHAVPFYWNRRCTELVLALQNDFDLSEARASRELLPCDAAWHWFGEASPFSVFIEGADRPVVAISWAWTQHLKENVHVLAATAWCKGGSRSDALRGTPMNVLWYALPEGSAFSDFPDRVGGTYLLDPEHALDERSRSELQQLGRLVLTMSTFLRQELLQSKREPLERHARRRLERRHDVRGNPKDLFVNVVYLRRIRSQSEGETPASQVKHYDNWQWSVRGHTRQQWYASLQTHLPVYIHPYLKGPESAPLKPRSTPIIAVTR
jgi:hypothetical protein